MLWERNAPGALTKMIKAILVSIAMLAVTVSCVIGGETSPEPKPGYVIARMPDGRVIQVRESVVEGDASSYPADTRAGSGTVNTSPGSGQGGGGGGGSGITLGNSGGGSGGGGTSSRGGGGGGVDVYSDDGVGPDASDPNRRRIRVFAWDRSVRSQFTSITQTIIADPRRGTPEHIADAIANQLERDRPARFVLRLWKELHPAREPVFDLNDPVRVFTRGGMHPPLADYWYRFANRLRLRGHVPEYVVQDLEDGMGYWHVPDDDRTVFFRLIQEAEPHLNGILPGVIFSTDLDALLDRSDPAGAAARRAYAQSAYDIRRDMTRNSIQGPLNRGFGVDVAFSNYKDLLPNFDLYWYTGGGTHLPSSISGISAPATYLFDRGRTGRYARTTKHPRWNRLIDAINQVRSCAASGPVHPWIAPPGYGRTSGDMHWARPSEMNAENWLWDVQMKHMLEMGIDTYILWNPEIGWNPNAPMNDRFMEGWFGGVTAFDELLILPEIPLDANVIETNGFRTTYDEFVNRMGYE